MKPIDVRREELRVELDWESKNEMDVVDFILSRDRTILKKVLEPMLDCSHFHNTQDRRCNCGMFNAIKTIKENLGEV
jgi:hypothetical protein